MIKRLNPDTLVKSPAFSQTIIVEPGAKLIFVGGQNAVNANGEVIGQDIAGQTARTMHNVVAALAAAGASLKDVVSMKIYVVEGHDLQDGYETVAKFSDLVTHPPTISVVVVTALAHPDCLIEIEAIAAIKPGGSA